jgi:hypothetical protein
LAETLAPLLLGIDSLSFCTHKYEVYYFSTPWLVTLSKLWIFYFIHPTFTIVYIWVLLFFDVSHGLLVYETCAKITVLNGELDEKNYMEQLGRFIVDVQEQNVYV